VSTEHIVAKTCNHLLTLLQYSDRWPKPAVLQNWSSKCSGSKLCHNWNSGCKGLTPQMISCQPSKHCAVRYQGTLPFWYQLSHQMGNESAALKNTEPQKLSM